jgi:hypothetical protein
VSLCYLVVVLSCLVLFCLFLSCLVPAGICSLFPVKNKRCNSMLCALVKNFNIYIYIYIYNIRTICGVSSSYICHFVKHTHQLNTKDTDVMIHALFFWQSVLRVHPDVGIVFTKFYSQILTVFFLSFSCARCCILSCFCLVFVLSCHALPCLVIAL